MRAMSDPAEMSGRELLEAALRGAAPAPPYVRLLRMRFIAVSDGSATFEMPATTELYNPNNVVHGGALASLADSAMGFAVFSTLLPGENFTTAELHLNFLKAVTADSGMLRSIGRVVHRGQQIAVAEAEIVDQQHQLIARASSTNVVLQRRAPPPTDSSLPASTQEPAVAATQPPVRFAAPPSPLERAPTPTVSPPMTTELIGMAPLARGKRKIRTFAGDIAYLRTGQGPPLVLLHGIPSSSYLWRDVIEPLSATFEVLAPVRVTEEMAAEWTRPFRDLGGRRTYLRAARSLNNRDLTSRAKHIDEIETPTLILWGANDAFLEPGWAETLHRRLRESTVQIIDPGGHFLPLDRPDAVVEAITRFLTTR